MAQPTPEIRAERRRLRALRLAVPVRERVSAERAIAASLVALGVAGRGRRVAAYLAMPGEANLDAVIRAAQRSGASVFVPVITHRRRGEMRFVELRAGCPLRSNRRAFGIREPAAARMRAIALRSLDVVLVPVVGFDRAGHRLGMGAGYYDRALRRRGDGERAWRRPRLIGIAYACQEIARIEPSPWDVALDAIVTEREVITPRRAVVAGREE